MAFQILCPSPRVCGSLVVAPVYATRLWQLLYRLILHLSQRGPERLVV